MENKRSIIIIVFGILALLTPVLLFLDPLPFFFRIIFFNAYLGFCLHYLYMLVWLINGIGILHYKSWSIKLIIILSGIGIIGCFYGMWLFPILTGVKTLNSIITVGIKYILYSVLSFLYYLSFIIFFSNAKIREYFK